MDIQTNIDSDLNPEALLAEVQKWQERVPRLVAALRDKSDELDNLRTELRNHRSDEDDVRLAARDALIAELESRCHALAGENQDLTGALHAAMAEAKNAGKLAQSLQAQWDDLKEQLDAAAADHESRLRACDEQLHEMSRNADQMRLDLAQSGKQVGQLTVELEEQKTATENVTAQLQNAQDENTALGKNNKLLNTQIAAVSKELDAAQHGQAHKRQLLEEAREMGQEFRERQSQLQQDLRRAKGSAQHYMGVAQAAARTLADLEQTSLEATADSSVSKAADLLALKTQCAEHILVLEQSLAQGDQTITNQVLLPPQRVEEETEQSVDKGAPDGDDLARLRRQLEDRSDLVLELEQELSELKQAHTDAVAEKESLSQELESECQRAQTFKEHVTTLEGKLQNQQELVVQIEQELRDVQDQAGEDRHAAEDRLKDQTRLLQEQQTKIEELSYLVEDLEKQTPDEGA